MKHKNYDIGFLNVKPTEENVKVYDNNKNTIKISNDDNNHVVVKIEAYNFSISENNGHYYIIRHMNNGKQQKTLISRDEAMRLYGKINKNIKDDNSKEN